jgi:hypothetical protein
MSLQSPTEAAFKVVGSWLFDFFEPTLGGQVATPIRDAMGTFGEIASSGSKYWGEEWRAKVDELDALADRQLMEFFVHYLKGKGYRVGEDGGHWHGGIQPSAN